MTDKKSYNVDSAQHIISNIYFEVNIEHPLKEINTFEY
jgi:hypothetical protein